jgi:hypothetical protein
MDGAKFLPLGKAQAALSVSSRSQMQHFYLYIPHLYVQSRQTRLFPAGYIQALAKHLGDSKPIIRRVREFCESDLARHIHVEERQRLTTAINSRDEHTPTQIAELLGVGRATVSGWIKAGVLPFEEKRLKQGEIVLMGPRQRRVMGWQFVKADTLHEVLQWVAPY